MKFITNKKYRAKYGTNPFFKLMCMLLLCTCKSMLFANLDTLAIKYGTDKSSAGHNYTQIYELYFNPLQNKCIKFLEIGFAGGPSAHMWDTYFTNPFSRLYFIDINPDCFKYTHDLSSRCSLHLVNQGSEAELNQWIQSVGGDFDLIIDDGGHQMQQQITSFKTLFPHLKKGGLYIIEDLHTSYWRDYGSAGDCQSPMASSGSTIRFLQNLIDDLNFSAARTESANRNKYIPLLENLTLYQKQISSIHFYTSLCVIFKN